MESEHLSKLDSPLVSGRRRQRPAEMMLMVAKKKNWHERVIVNGEGLGLTIPPLSSLMTIRGVAFVTAKLFN